MTVEIDLLRYIGVYVEPGAYQVDRSGTPGDFKAFPYKEGSLKAQLGRAQLDPMAGKMRLDGHSKKVLGIRSCTLGLDTTLHSHGLDLDGTVDTPTSPTWPLGDVLNTIMGGRLDDGGPFSTGSVQTTVQAGSTTTVVNVTTGHSRFTVGGVIACQVVPGSPVLEAREILSIATDAITVKEAFSAIPVTGQPVRGGVTFYLTEDPDASLQVLVEGRESSDAYVLRGLQGGFTLNLPIGDLGTLSLALSGAGWSRLSSGVTIPQYTHFSPMLLSPLELTAPVVGNSERVLVEQASLSIEPQITYAPVKSGAASETIARMRRQPTRPVAKGSFVCPRTDDTWDDARDNRESRAIFAQCGNVAGSIVLVSLPTVQITDVQPATADQGIAGQQVSFEARHDEAIGGSTELGYSAIRLHFV